MTLDLPAALKPWRAELELFPPDLAAALGAVIARVSLLVGPLERAAASAIGELDGVMGISRRGPFERLLRTEWALFDAWPDEFMRRAASGELAFYEMARREPRDDRRSIALFDAGVTQLGGPRIVHVAALVMLHARAREAGADFAWGIAQDGGCSLVLELTRSSVLHLVRSRFDAPAMATDIARWRETLDAQRERPARPIELWMIGDTRGADAVLDAGGRALVVEDSLEPGRRDWVDVTARVRGRPPRSAALPLPDPRACIRLLRDPFEVSAPRPALAPRVKRRFVFGAGGRHLFARTETGSIVTFAVPNSPKAPRVEPATWTPPKDHTLVAVGHQRGPHRRTSVITSSSAGFTLHELARGHRSTYHSRLLRMEAAEAPVIPADMASLCSASDGASFFIDAHRRLFQIWNGALRDGPSWRAIGLRSGDAEIEALTEGPEVRPMAYRGDGWQEASSVPIVAEDAAATAHLGTRRAIAVRAGQGVWRARAGGGPDRLIPANDELVVGVMGEHASQALDVMLLVLNPSERCIDLVMPGGARKRTLQLGVPIDHAQTSEHGPNLVVFAGSTLLVFDLLGRECARYVLDGPA